MINGKRVRELRGEESLRDLSTRMYSTTGVAVSHEFIRQIEDGRRVDIQTATAVALATTLGVGISDILISLEHPAVA